MSLMTQVLGTGRSLQAAIEDALTRGATARVVRFQVLHQHGEWNGREIVFFVEVAVWSAENTLSNRPE
jgi:hypothetical protein